VSQGNGSVFNNLKTEILKSHIVRIPDQATQQRSAELLSALDDKIELNWRLNETLEAMVLAIFSDWLVDFGPVRRKMQGATEPIAILGRIVSDPAVAGEIAALFPDALSNDGLPLGWSKGTLADLAVLNPESWTTRTHPASVEYVDLSSTKWGTIESTVVLKWSDAPTRARRIVRPLDTIVATTRPGNGSYAFISRDGYTASTGFAVLRPKDRSFAQLVYCAATQATNIARLAQLADGHGGTYPAVNPTDVAATPVPKCGMEIAKAFDTLTLPLRNRIEHAKAENRTLFEARDYLLPRLMAGAIEVGEAGRTSN
jgi:type I restriction enzyme S subunit